MGSAGHRLCIVTILSRLVRSIAQGVPSFNPLDVWVWEVIEHHGLSRHVHAPIAPLVGARRAPSVREAMG